MDTVIEQHWSVIPSECLGCLSVARYSEARWHYLDIPLLYLCSSWHTILGGSPYTLYSIQLVRSVCFNVEKPGEVTRRTKAVGKWLKKAQRLSKHIENIQQYISDTT